MRKLFTLVIASILACAISAAAKDVYGFMTGNSPDDGSVPIGLFAFDSDNPVPEEIKIVPYAFWGGAYANGTYYMILSDDSQGYLPEGLCTYDFDSNKIKLAYARKSYQCSDMTFDYSTNTMYGIQICSEGTTVPTALISIDLADGNSTKIAELPVKIQAVACTYYGDMFAMGPDGTLYTMNVNTGELAKIGSTGIRTDNTERQSLEFDRATGRLFWTGLDINSDPFFIELDPATARVIERKNPYDNSLIVGLHIPFEIAAAGAPAKPSELTSKVAGNQVLLSWRNPDTTTDGRPLDKALTRIEVWRNNSLAHTLSEPVAGQISSWVDTDATGATRYIVYACNEAGRSEGATLSIVAGEDTPSEPSEVTVTVNDGVPTISWKAPQTGVNGGSINPQTLSYTLIRQPGNTVVENLNTTEYIDNTITMPAYYTWSVTASNVAGTSKAASSVPTAAGPAIEAPFATAMTSDMEIAQWKIADANGDGYTWQSKASGGFTYSTSWTNTANDSLVSVPFHLEQGVNYTARYTIYAPEMFSKEDFSLSIRGNKGVTELEKLTDFTNKEAESRMVDFTVDADGIYTFGLTALSKPGQWQISISAFGLSKAADIDLAAISAANCGFAIQNCDSRANVVIANFGKQSVNSYKVSVVDENGIEIGSEIINEPLAPECETTVVVKFLPQQAGEHTYTVNVAAEGDGETANNSIPFPVFIVSEDETPLEVAKGDVYTNYPFWFEGYPFCYAEAIYLKEELGNIDSGEIQSISLDYFNLENDIRNVNVRVYLANTPRTSVAEGWMVKEAMTLVYDGPISLIKGENNTLMLPLDKPFKYKGDNLCILYEKENDHTTGNVGFAAVTTVDVRTAIYNSYTEGVDMNHVQGATRLTSLLLMVSDAVGAVSAIEAGSDKPVEMFNLHGMPVANPGPGIYIRRQGSRTSKVIVR